MDCQRLLASPNDLISSACQRLINSPSDLTPMDCQRLLASPTGNNRSSSDGPRLLSSPTGLSSLNMAPIDLLISNSPFSTSDPTETLFEDISEASADSEMRETLNLNPTVDDPLDETVKGELFDV